MTNQRYRSEKIDPRRNLYTYYVSGNTSFPIDMLRHDECWPCDPSTIELISQDFLESNVSVKIKSHRAPTIDRWLSFGWSVGDDDLYGRGE